MTATPDRLEIHAYSRNRQASCPACGQESRRVHGWYARHPQEISSVERTVRLVLAVKRFRCVNPACVRKTFAEPLSGWLPAYARRTLSLTEVLYAMALEIGGEVAHRVAARLGIRVSAATLLRILRQIGAASPPSVLPIIGVDDWALKRGRTYGTVVVNLSESRNLVFVLTLNPSPSGRGTSKARFSPLLPEGLRGGHVSQVKRLSGIKSKSGQGACC